MRSMICLLISFSLSAQTAYQFAGKHFFASYLGCDQEALADVARMQQAMEAAVRASGATILGVLPYTFAADGLTMVFLLSESHASIHTYPEHGACFVDLFTCGDHCLSAPFDAALRAYLKPTDVRARLFFRGAEIAESSDDCDLTPDSRF
jgi:S-adenosylmethionine decarboxylase